MGRTYWGENGSELDVNFHTAHVIDQLTFGLWDTIGTPTPLPESDTKLIARILRNYVVLLNRILDNQDLVDYAKGLLIPVHPLIGDETKAEATKFWSDIAEWFENCGGLITEGEHYRRAGMD